ncbi:MAG: hypothetical protein J6T70_10560 [Bacteroidales bacterium]|nr:hypothetical protein [Bacteroidales bacterium]MBO7597472.1 hypothetical protein [Bacteroidales bacterium]
MEIQKYVNIYKSIDNNVSVLAIDSFALLFIERYIIEIRSNENIIIKRKTDEQIRKEGELTEVRRKDIGINSPLKEKWNSIFKIANRDMSFEIEYFPLTEDIAIFSIAELIKQSVDNFLLENIDYQYHNELLSILNNIAKAFNQLNKKK